MDAITQPIQLSVIVAAYNIEHSIDTIFEHILHSHKLDALEVIIVNDGSSDATLQKAQDYRNRYPKLVRVIDKENGGHGSTLSAGFKLAKGRYCRPLDGDDWLDENGLDKLIDFLSTSDMDMVLSDFSRYNIDTKRETIAMNPVPTGEHHDFHTLIETQTLLPYHGLVYKTEILRAIPELDHHCFYVDNEYDAYPLPYVKTWSYLPGVVYVHTVGNAEQSTSLHSLVRNINNIATVCFSLLKYRSEHTTIGDSSDLIELYALNAANLFTRASFGLPASEGKDRLQRFYKRLHQLYPDTYKHGLTHLSKLFYIMRRSNCQGYGLMRQMVDRLNRKSLIW